MPAISSTLDRDKQAHTYPGPERCGKIAAGADGSDAQEGLSSVLEETVSVAGTEQRRGAEESMGPETEADANEGKKGEEEERKKDARYVAIKK